MEYSKNFNFALPSRDNDVDLADINEISNNFRKIDENSVKKEVGKGLSTNDFTDEYKSKVENALTSENIDQTYSPESENAQSGIAVKEAIKTVIDSEMSDTSENPVQNKVVKKYVDEGHTVKLVGMLNLDIAEQGLYYTNSIGYRGNVLGFGDFCFILYSKGLNDRKTVIVVSSTGIKRLNLLNMKTEPIYNYTIIDDALSDISNNAIANKVVTQALLQQEIDLKNYADSLKVTVDAEISDTSENPVQNKVVKGYIDDKTKQGRLIYQTTLTEDVHQISISKDSTGQEFSLNNFAVIVCIPASPTLNILAYISLKINDFTSYWNTTVINKGEEGKKHVVIFRCDRDNGLWSRMAGTALNQNHTNLYMPSIKGVEYWDYYVNNKNKFEAARSITLSPTGENSVMPKGTKIEVYGR